MIASLETNYADYVQIAETKLRAAGVANDFVTWQKIRDTEVAPIVASTAKDIDSRCSRPSLVTPRRTPRRADVRVRVQPHPVDHPARHRAAAGPGAGRCGRPHGSCGR